jgi:hypothetical protein
VEQDRVRSPQVDRVPDDGGWLRFDARTLPLVPQQATVELTSGETVRLPVAVSGDDHDAALLALFPNDPPGPGDAAVLRPAPVERGGIYLPLAWR